MVKERLLSIFNSLLSYYGPQYWWPADTPFEMAVGAILTQNTTWTSVTKAIENLKSKNILSPEGILACSHDELANCIKPTGFFNQKAKRLKTFCKIISDQFYCKIENMLIMDVYDLRGFLLSINGIGKETADSIILYGANKPIFVVDAYTKRLFTRLGVLENENMSYDDVQKIFMDNLDLDVKLFNEYHALIVAHCKNLCTKKPAKCHICPLINRCCFINMQETVSSL